MKKKVLLIVCGTVLVGISILMVFLGNVFLSSDKPKDIVLNSDFKKVTLIGNYNLNQSVIYKDYDSFQSTFQSDIKKDDFQKNHYLLIPIRVDSCSEENVTPVDYQIKDQTVIVTVEYIAKCGLCAPTTDYYVLAVDKKYDHLDVEFQNKAVNNPHCDPNVDYKPMIYLYPKEKTEVEVVLGNSSVLSTTYPKYHDSWNVIAYPDGSLMDSKTNREYYGLFWEGVNHPSIIHDTGFVVKKEDTVSFLEEKLRILGLTEKEADEFIIYWLPKLEVNSYNYIYFESMEEIEGYMPLSITPSPDTIIRIQMDYKPLTKPIKVVEQELKPMNRDGFTVVEWGGSIIQ